MKVTLYLRSKCDPHEITKHRLNLIKARDSVLVEIAGDKLYNIMEIKPNCNEMYMELHEEEFMSLPICANSEFIGILIDEFDELDYKVVL